MVQLVRSTGPIIVALQRSHFSKAQPWSQLYLNSLSLSLSVSLFVSGALFEAIRLYSLSVCVCESLSRAGTD